MNIFDVWYELSGRVRKEHLRFLSHPPQFARFRLTTVPFTCVSEK